MLQLNEMKVLVVGASRGTGLQVTRTLLAAGATVTAFARSASSIEIDSPRLRKVDGDATSFDNVDAAVAGHDAVIVTLGISDNPLGVRFFGRSNTPLDIRSTGTRTVIAAMSRHGVQRLVVQSTYGIGETSGRLGWVNRLFFEIVLKPQIADSMVQEGIVRASDLDWVLAQPVHLTDDEDDSEPVVTTDGATGRMKVSRTAVATVLAAAAVSDDFVGRTVAISG